MSAQIIPLHRNPSIREAKRQEWEGKHLVYWVHLCSEDFSIKEEMRGFACPKCGLRSIDDHMGPYDDPKGAA